MTTITIPELRVIAQASTKKPGQVIALIGKQLCFFENGCNIPAPGESVNVMITRPLYAKKEEAGALRYDFKKVMALLIRPVTEEDFLLYHRGFECAGSMCATTASIYYSDQPKDRPWPYPMRTEFKRGKSVTLGDLAWATPGRTQIFETDNVNTRPYTMDYAPSVVASYHEKRPLRPGWAYFRKFEGRLRCEGLILTDDAMYAPYVRK